MPDNQVTPEKFYLEHCEGHFKDGERERARILEVVGEVSENAAVKREEIERFNTWVTDWEFSEYSYHL